MKGLLVTALGLAALAAQASTAVAADGCGRGWYWNGFQCAPRYAAPQRHYGPPPGYRSGYDRPIYGESNFGRPEVYFRPYVDQRGRLVCRQRGFTVQDGICKPYRGY